MTPFAYPKARHERTFSPPPGKTNRYYKPFLKQEFVNKCVYCRTPDGVKGSDSFGVDHYKPKTLFPEAATDYSNLFYACNSCNAYKGDFWPDSKQREWRYFIPNPCDHIMFEHLRYRGDTIETRTDAGRCAIEILGLNEEKQIEYRRMLLDLITYTADTRQRVQETIARLEKQIKGSTDATARVGLVSSKTAHEKELAHIERVLQRLSGE